MKRAAAVGAILVAGGFAVTGCSDDSTSDTKSTTSASTSVSAATTTARDDGLPVDVSDIVFGLDETVSAPQSVFAPTDTVHYSVLYGPTTPGVEGEWTLTVKATAPDGRSAEVGRLAGAPDLASAYNGVVPETTKPGDYTIEVAVNGIVAESGTFTVATP